MNKKVFVFSNNKKISQKLINKLYENEICAEAPVFTDKKLQKNISKVIDAAKDKQIILAFKNEELKDVTEVLHNHGMTNVFIYPWDTHFISEEGKALSEFIIPIDISKPRLEYLEIDISESCNLNCKGCYVFSNLVAGNHHLYELEFFRKDLERMKELFWGIGKIRLQGGEPLLNPEFSMFVKTAREIFPDSDIRLVSNGLLIPGLNKLDLEVIKNSNCSFDISSYPPTQKKSKEIADRLNNAGISYHFSLPIKMFFHMLLPKPLESPNESFNNCLFTNCHVMGNGILSACSHQFYVSRLNSAFDMDYPVDEVIDIYHSSLNGWEINEIFKKPHDFCRYCPKGMVPFKWKTKPASMAKASDWVVKDSFVNMKVIPVIQRLLKLFAIKLRHFKQRPKTGRR